LAVSLFDRCEDVLLPLGKHALLQVIMVFKRNNFAVGWVLQLGKRQTLLLPCRVGTFCGVNASEVLSSV
jgi:hypothetical protein